MNYMYKLYLACIIGLSAIPLSYVFAFSKPNELIYLSIPIVMSLTSLGMILFFTYYPNDKITATSTNES